MALVFYIAAALAIAAAINVVFQRTPVYSALSLIVVLCSLAVMYLLMGAPFMAMIQVIVYAGAIMVLFVLVIMLLNARKEVPSQRSRFAHWLAAPLLAAFLIEVLTVVRRQFPVGGTPSPAGVDGSPGAVGNLLFHNYVLPFEVTSVLILVAVLGAVVLAKREF